ncbi:MAG: site-specific integrase [Ignavibacteriota bacterium]|jgi:integrase|nr:site-specific integrase [Ignavibacteriota bacterium]MBV6420937.1 Tyrosine recombinase XerC [Ignavibacteriaceae bacterium]MCO6447157.1 site-specific integrase [Ignavibacterium album]MDT3696795.1 site-specific integrase [Ignavibacterium sp.]QKJ99235.1 MAG: site-specific integrase [Ignavibacteriota bacterium]
MKVPVVKLVPVRRKNKISYQLDYNLNGKRIREIVAHNKRDAELIRADRQQKLTLGIHGIYPAQSKIISLKELIAQYLNTKSGIVRKTTYSRYKNYFDGFEKFMYKYFSPACENIILISSKYLQACFNRLTNEPVNKKKPWHKNTVNILRDLLIEMFNNAIKEKYIDTNPASETVPFKVPKTNTVKYYTDDQLKVIWENLDPYWVPIFKFYVYTGLRKKELINLTWDNVSMDENNPTMTIISTDEFQTKSGKIHTIRMTKTAFEILKQQVGKHSRYVFVNEKGKKIRQATPNEKLNKVLSKTDFKGTIHMLRHTFGANFVMKIGSYHELMNFLSHSDLESTKIYAHFSPDYMRETAEKLDKIQNGN